MSTIERIKKHNVERIKKHNEPLHAAMVKQGYKLHSHDGLQHYVDAEGGYVSYPPGYITGPSRCEYGPTDWYISVQGHSGWHQRSFVNSDMQKFVGWAIAESDEITRTEPAAER